MECKIDNQRRLLHYDDVKIGLVCEGCSHYHLKLSQLETAKERKAMKAKEGKKKRCMILNYKKYQENPYFRCKYRAFREYDRLITHKALAAMKGFRWCSHPGCGAGHIHEGGNQEPIMTCTKCATKTCFKHKAAWHSGKTCDEFDKELKNSEEAANAALLSRTTKQCPNCQVPIEKNQGCDHMTCGHCNHEFCWLCLADYRQIMDNDNSYHNRTCEHYSPPAGSDSD